MWRWIQVEIDTHEDCSCGDGSTGRKIYVCGFSEAASKLIMWCVYVTVRLLMRIGVLVVKPQQIALQCCGKQNVGLTLVSWWFLLQKNKVFTVAKWFNVG